MEVGNPHPTIYIQNLNEKIRPDYIKQTLEDWLKPCGMIVTIVVKKRLALRGQAWIQFDSTESAHKAIAFLQGRRMYGKTVNVRFAKYKSDDVSKADGSFEVEKYHREQEKAAKARNPRPTRRQVMQQLMSNPGMANMPMMGMPGAPMHAPGAMGLPMGVASDMQLPNKILFIQQLPPGTTEDALSQVYSRSPGFVEVRSVPGRPDLAFIEFEGEAQAAAARAATDNYEIIRGAHIRVTFARR